MNELHKTEVEMTKEEITEEIRCYCQDSEKIIKASERELKTIPIPDNATNGDMIKAMFPNAIIQINELGSMVHIKYNNHTCWVNYELEWWNSPYKKEVKE